MLLEERERFHGFKLCQNLDSQGVQIFQDVQISPPSVLEGCDMDC